MLHCPQVALFPRHYVKHRGDDEEGAEAHPVDPCCYLLPAVIRQPMEEGAAHDGRNDEECVCVAISSMFVARWFVAAIGWGPMVHETLESIPEPH